MEWKKVMILLLFWTIVKHVNIAFYQSDASAYSSSSYSALKKWFKLLSGWTSRAELNHGSSIPHIESSFTPEEDLRYASRQAFHLRQNSGCSCSSDGFCSTTCTSLESKCFSFCTITTEFYALYTTTSSITSSSTSYDFILASTVTYYFYSTSTISETSSTIYSTSCSQVTCTSTATADDELTITVGAATITAGAGAIVAGAAVIAAGAAAIALAVGIAVPVSIGSAAAAANIAPTNQANEIQEQVGQFLSIGEPVDNPVPVNDLPIPVPGINLPDDGCGNSSVRFQGGGCYPVLRRGPCRSPYFWVTVNPVTLLGQCSPRLCGRSRVFVGTDGLCHDSEGPITCSGGRILYYTAYEDPICDCPIGQYPFPGTLDDCVTLFTRGPCPLGQVVAITRTGNLRCTPSECQFNANLPLARHNDGLCYVYGSQGPCRSQPFQLFGYDVFKLRSICVNVTARDSPYFVSGQEANFIDDTFNQLLPEYDDFRVFLVNSQQSTAKRRNWNSTSIERQGALTGGLFQLPSRLPNPQLNPCRPGAQNGNNYKCTNPLVSTGRKGSILQAVRSAFECPDDSVLQATGRCGNDAQGASCGPSYQYIENIGQCRKTFQQ